ncbi:PREDICTED: uncharacterized protein LOC109475403 [Branchiostoma belcheri]|uniref:Uncharacterized protein LOC109475403 n=1 Tax=Branchiostoma belcheri TaxID=7741 RepID=A0A6P4ZPH0_BRABE|nr:PREDICTED: uncharacterized protein LOC109475403 [Branchiostoma belcheri]
MVTAQTGSPCLRVKKGVKMIHLNIRSLLPKLDEIRAALINNPVDILTLNETWLDPSIDDNELYIPNYTLYRKDRNRQGVGVACYVTDNLQHKLITELTELDIEGVWVEVKHNVGKPIVIGSVYRPPNSTTEFFENLETAMTAATAISDEVFLLGDLNCDVFKSRSCKKIDKICSTFQAKQLIDEPTRVNENSSTCIDIIIATLPEKVSESGVCSTGLSDHCFTYAVRKAKRPSGNPRTATVRSYRRFDETAFQQDLHSAPWSTVEECTNIDDALSSFQTMLTEICDKHAPWVSVRIRGHEPPWITQEYLSMARERDFYFDKAKKTKHPSMWETAKKARNKCNNMARYLKNSITAMKSKLKAVTVKVFGPHLRPFCHHVKPNNMSMFLNKKKKTLRMNSIHTLPQLALNWLQLLRVYTERSQDRHSFPLNSKISPLSSLLSN